jgi:TPR repeat protein/serine/threonine protein kinase
MTCYNRAGQKIIFGGLVGSGGEADVYRLDSHPQFVVKKYHAGRVPPVEKLQLMLKNPPADPTLKQNHVSIAWITDLLYDQKEQICGYVMPEISEGRLLFNSYNPSLRRKHFPGFSWKHLHRTARNLSSAIAAIHSRGYVIGDLNESNILVQADTLITIIDTDSFQVRDSSGKCFRCPVGKAEYTAPEIQRACLSEIDRNEYHDRFSMGIILFLLLMEGSHPFRGKGEPAELHERIRKNLFPYSRSGDFSQAPAISLPFSALYKDLQELFRRCFIDGVKSPEKRPSALEWVSALKIAEENLVCCSVNPCHYYQKSSHKCIWCERAALMRGTDCFPDPIFTGLPEQEPLLPISHNGVAPRVSEMQTSVVDKEFNSLIEKAQNGDINAQFNLGLCYFDGSGVAQDHQKAVYWYTKAAEQGHVDAQSNLVDCYFDGSGVDQDYQKAVFWCTKAAEQGLAEAQCGLGLCYFDGSGVAQDYQKAVYWYTKAAEQGLAFAQYGLGSCYDNGSGVDQDYQKAVYWYTKAAEQGDAVAQFNLGFCYDNGSGVAQDYQKAVYWYTKAAEQGQADAQDSLGTRYYNGEVVAQDYQKAVYWYTKAAEQGHAFAQCSLGTRYYNGEGVAQDYNKAVYWYTKAVEQGLAFAQFNLGFCYDNGSGVAQDYQKAVYWYTKAAEQGHAVAQCILGTRYYNGEGVAQDYNKAVYWYTKAAEQGDAVAQFSLGVCYDKGSGVAQDNSCNIFTSFLADKGSGVAQDCQKAFYWYTKAAEQGHAVAQFSLGNCYYNGSGVAQDCQKAFYWYTKAAEQGHAVAQLGLGNCYYNGFGVAKDYKKAVYWYTKAAEQGHAVAQCSLGTRYYNGEGVAQDYNKAVYWYTKAVEQGLAFAQFSLGLCYDKGSGVAQDYQKAVYWYTKAAEQGHAEAQTALKGLNNNNGGCLQALFLLISATGCMIFFLGKIFYSC